MKATLDNKPEEKKGPSEARTISVVMDSIEIVEDLAFEGLRRGYKSKSQAAKKIIELGYEDFLKLPVLESRR